MGRLSWRVSIARGGYGEVGIYLHCCREVHVVEWMNAFIFTRCPRRADEWTIGSKFCFCSHFSSLGNFFFFLLLEMVTIWNEAQRNIRRNDPKLRGDATNVMSEYSTGQPRYGKFTGFSTAFESFFKNRTLDALRYNHLDAQLHNKARSSICKFSMFGNWCTTIGGLVEKITFDNATGRGGYLNSFRE